MNEQLGPGAALDQLREDLPQIREAARELPGVVRYLSEQISNDALKFDLNSPELEEIRDQLKAQHKQRFTLTVGASALVCGTLVLSLGSNAILGWTLVAVGALISLAGRPKN